ncbi:MAG: TraR/DksA family transcriptional regulator [Acidobacteria bacterium]|nr:TraR/DksA family transcriptional regulator [Acidobacteriota bacterium]
MDKRKVAHYRKQLLAKQEEICRMVARSDQDGREADNEITQDLADRAANSYTKEFLFHQSDDNRRILQLIQEALRRADEGSYGLCVECQQGVQSKRLDAVPWARHCIECQEKQEKGLL